ncbi:MAG TPA: GyrI-like domain-containing protein [Steroidobacteraceae bacterium]|nr:GyrI-like domain-containing protein [Steroidobacteraceae bacterium]
MPLTQRALFIIERNLHHDLSLFERTPEQVRESGSLEGLDLASPLRLSERAHSPLAEPRIERTRELRFVGLSEPCDYGRTAHIPGQWQRFMREFFGRIAAKRSPIPVGIGTRRAADEQLLYVCAAEVSGFVRVPPDLITLALPPATYAVFAHDGHVSALPQTYSWIWDEWFAASGRVPAEAASLERHNAAFDPRTGEGGATIWVAIAD